MEIQTTVRVRNDQEIEEYFNFDEILNIRYYEKIGEKLFKVIIRLPECEISVRKGTTLKSIKEKVIEVSGDYPIKSKVFFTNGTKRMMYAQNEFWAEEYAKNCAERHNTKVAGIERMEGSL